MSIFFIFFIGLFFGSFLNVLIDRLPRNEKITGRSYCENCKKTLTWKDLIPVISFVYLRGKCRYCKKTLSYQYPLLEILTGALFVFTFNFALNGSVLNFNHSFLNIVITEYFIFSLFCYLFIISSFIVIFFADLKYGIIPDKVLVPAILVTFIYLLIAPSLSQTSYSGLMHPIIINFLSALGAFIFFLAIFILTRGRGMGFGDVKLVFFLGLVLGFPGTPLALYIAFLTGGLVGIILILWKKKSLKLAVPFGPFLIMGALISFFFSENIIPKILPFFY